MTTSHASYAPTGLKEKEEGKRKAGAALGQPDGLRRGLSSSAPAGAQSRRVEIRRGVSARWETGPEQTLRGPLSEGASSPLFHGVAAAMSSAVPAVPSGPAEKTCGGAVGFVA